MDLAETTRPERVWLSGAVPIFPASATGKPGAAVIELHSGGQTRRVMREA